MKQISQVAAYGAMLLLGACTGLQQDVQPEAVSNAEAARKDNGELPTTEAVDNGTGEVGEVAAPTEEQQKAAQQLLEGKTMPDPIPVVDTQDEDPPAPPDLENGVTSNPVFPVPTESTVPSGRGIRMGTLAPPEEAASVTGESAPMPNKVDRRGLRSLPLPKGLPMDMDGKLNPESSR